MTMTMCFEGFQPRSDARIIDNTRSNAPIARPPRLKLALAAVSAVAFTNAASASAYVAPCPPNHRPLAGVQQRRLRARSCQFNNRGSAIWLFRNKKDPNSADGERADASGSSSSTRSTAPFTSNVFIVDEDGGEQGDQSISGASIVIVDESDKSGVRSPRMHQEMGGGSDESSSSGASQHLTDLFINTAGDTRRKILSPFTQNIDYFLKYIPIVSPIAAYFTYEEIMKIFDVFIELLSQRNWYPVDGGQYQAQIITPAVNGIVVPAISILFATLIANTVSTLRQRQLDIRTTLNTEAGEIRVLQAMIDSFPEAARDATRTTLGGGGGRGGLDAQDRCRAYLLQYTKRLLAESQPEVEVDNLMFTGSMDSELNALVVELNKVTLACSGAAEGGSSTSTTASATIPAPILSESYGAVTRLNAERSTRISAIQSTYPMLHYIILTVLAASICICFVLESDQQLLFFLNAVQLKLLWTMLVGTFSALSVVCYDLGDPFRGYYQITRSLDQFYTIRDALKASDQMKKAERGETFEDSAWRLL